MEARMARPDLATPEGRKAYGAELRGIARPWRYVGFTIVILGTAAMIFVARTTHELLGSKEGQASIAAIAFGWALLVVAIVKRTRYNGRRMRGEPG
jgi:hypothetical protein